jgi:hypothetical protein
VEEGFDNLGVCAYNGSKQRRIDEVDWVAMVYHSTHDKRQLGPEAIHSGRGENKNNPSFVNIQDR